MLELVIVISVIMILLAFAVPAYQQHVIRAREAVLLDTLHQLDSLIQQYTLDNKKAPQSVDDLVTAGYLAKPPIDPMTGKADWVPDPEDTANAADPEQLGIKAVHSASQGTAIDGSAYSTW